LRRLPAIGGTGGWLAGRLLQGISAGLVGVVVPLYLAECLTASQRGKARPSSSGFSRWGSSVAAVIGYSFSLWVNEIEKLNDADKLFAFKNIAWRSIFWVSAAPRAAVSRGQSVRARVVTLALPPWQKASGRWLPCSVPARRNKRKSK